MADPRMRDCATIRRRVDCHLPPFNNCLTKDDVNGAVDPIAKDMTMDRRRASVTDNVVLFPREFELAKLDPATALSCLRSAITDIEDVYRRYGQNGLSDRHRASLERALAMTSYVRNRM